MKKLALTTVCALTMTGAAFAQQGYVNFGVISPAAMTAQTNTSVGTMFGGPGSGGTVGPTALTANSFYYELLYTTYSGSQATIPSLASLLTWQDSLLGANNSSSSAGKLVPIGANSAAPVPWAAGTTDSIVLVGWSANLGTTWGTVSNLLATQGSGGTYAAGSFFGVSSTGFIAAGSSSVLGATVFNNAPVDGTGTPIFSLNTQLYLLPSVPEPTTMALAGLGGLSLLLFRRQRK